MALWWTVVPPSEAHLVVHTKGGFVASPDEGIAGDGGRKAYFAIPESIPWIGRRVRIIPLTIQELNVELLTYEKGQARFMAATSAKYKVVNVRKAAETIITMDVLKGQLVEIIKAATTAVSSTYDVTEIRSKKEEIQEKIKNQITDDFAAWGLELVNFQVSDISDAGESKVVTNISRRREVEIEADTRQQNANRLMQARTKEAEADETARKREIERDQVVAQREQEKNKLISVQMKEAKEKEYDVVKVQTVRQAEITKEKAEVEAAQRKQVAIIQAEQEKMVTEVNKEMAAINKDKLFLEGEGERLKKEQIAIGEAAKVKQDLLAQADGTKAKLLAEAEGQERLQESLNKYTSEAVVALTAKDIVAMREKVGIATATALQNAQIRLFAGGADGKQAFNLAEMISSASFNNDLAGKLLSLKLGMPNSLGFDAKTLLGDTKGDNKKDTT